MKISYLTYFFQFLHITNLTIGIKSSTVFWRTDGVKMEATAIEVTNYVAAEQCLGVCIQNIKCKSFNAYSGNTTVPPKCEFFSKDSCSWNAKLVKKDNISFFDTVGDSKCGELTTFKYLAV